MQTIKPLRYASGFTLIELMLSLALGLVISAAAMMLFLTGQRSIALQQGSSDIQDNANFGLNYVVKDIRLANLNATSADSNDRSKEGGLVLTSAANQVTVGTPVVEYSNLPKTIDAAKAPVKWLSGGEVSDSNTGVKNDQLVIQYRPQYITDPENPANWFGGFDCEGNRISFAQQTGSPAVDAPLRIYIQRYFVRKDTNVSSNEPNEPYALACDAGWYLEGSPTDFNQDTTKGSVYGDNGQIVMKRVDYFHVMLGVQEEVSANVFNHRYISIKDYMALAQPTDPTKAKPRILSIQLGALTRSMQSVGRDSIIKEGLTFTVLDKNVTVKTPTGKPAKYVRQVVSQTIALRNTFGGRGAS